MAKKIYTVRFRQEFVETWVRYTGTFIEHCERWGVTRQTGYECEAEKDVLWTPERCLPEDEVLVVR